MEGREGRKFYWPRTSSGQALYKGYLYKMLFNLCTASRCVLTSPPYRKQQLKDHQHVAKVAQLVSGMAAAETQI